LILLKKSSFLFAIRIEQTLQQTKRSPLKMSATTLPKVFTAAALFPNLFESYRSELGEGPVWDQRQNRLTWVDITQSTLHVFDATSNEHSAHVLPNATSSFVGAEGGKKDLQPQCLSFAIPCEGLTPNTFICGSDSALFLWSPPMFESSPHTHCNDASHEHGAGAPNVLHFLEAVPQPDNSNNGSVAMAKIRANDAKIDPYGRLFWGTMDIAETSPVGALFCRDPRRHGNGCGSHEGPTAVRSERVIGGCTISNGIEWSPSFDVMYFVDSTTGCVFEVGYNTEVGYSGGSVDGGATLLDAVQRKGSNTRIVYRAPKGTFPDGICVDEVGCLWIALYGGGKVVRIDPKRRSRQGDDGDEAGNGGDVVLAEVVVPNALCITSICFGGPRLSQLFITTARDKRRIRNNTNNDAGGGHVFTAHVGVCGLPFHPYQSSLDAAVNRTRLSSHL
jgi:sugar lactone lactonase YvrE